MIRIATFDDLADILSIENKVFKNPWSKEQLSWELNHQSVADNPVSYTHLTLPTTPYV